MANNNEWIDIKKDEWIDVEPGEIMTPETMRRRQLQRFLQPLQQPANIALQTMQMLPGAKEYLNLEQQQAQQRQIIQNTLLNKLGGRFPVARGIAAEGLNYITPSSIIASGTLPFAGGKLLGKTSQLLPATRRFMQLRTPNLASEILKEAPVAPRYKIIRGQQVDITRPLPKELSNLARFRTDYISQSVFPRAQQFITKNIEKFTSGIENFARITLKIPERAIQTIKSKGVSAINAVREMYDDSVYPIVNRIAEGVENKRLQIDSFYRQAVNNFEGTINASPFRARLRMVLLKKGWIDQVGNPTSRFGGRLDPVLDDLTRLHQDLRLFQRIPTTGKKGAIKGFMINKEDFMTYRDLLNRMLKDRPSDIAVMELKDALYQSAEKSGMKGIVQARNLERVANQVEQKLFKKGLINERKLSNYHNLSRQELNELKELEYYIEQPFQDDLASIAAGKELDKINRITLDIPGKQEGLLSRLQKATSPQYFSQVRKDLEPLLGNYTNAIFGDIARHRTATGLKTFGKWGLGIGGSALAYSLLNRPIRQSIENIGFGGSQ